LSKITGFTIQRFGRLTAHPLYAQGEPSAPDTVDTYNVAVELGLNGPVINLIQESTHLAGHSERKVVASTPSDDGIPYFHSFGISKNYAVIVVQPLRLDVDITKMIELGFLRGMEHVDRTRVLVVDLNSGDLVLDQSVDEKVFFYHSISQAELLSDDDGTIVSLRLCAYKEPDQLTGEHQFMRLEQAKEGLEWRSKIHKGGKFCDINCDLKSQRVSVEWNEDIQQGFELPVTRYSRAYHGKDICPDTAVSPREQPHPRFVYSFGAYALGSPDYDNWGLFKFDLEENKIAAYFQQDSVYISEPVFVADPNGTKEDDGVLLTHAYFGEEQETKFLVLDAKTMDILATAPTGNRSPLEFHGAWIPSTRLQS
jgi:carotenoid cleavage dioxygenase-like enzyme